jgi:hypothetical protein
MKMLLDAGPAARRRDDRHRQDRRREPRAGIEGRPAPTARSSIPSAIPIHSEGGHLAILDGVARPQGVRCSRSLGQSTSRSRCSSTGHGPCAFDGEDKPRWRRSSTARSEPGRRSWSSATKVPRAAPACARCSPSPAPSRVPAAAATRRAHHRRPLLRRHPRILHRPRRPRGGRRRPDRAWSPTATCILHRRPRAHTLDLLVDDAELEKRRQAYAPLEPVYTRGVLAKFAKLVQGAETGAITNPR